MPDSQLPAEVAKQAQEHLSWWQVLAGGSGGLVAGRLVLSFLRRLGFSDSLAGAEAKMRQELMGELEAARKRLVEREIAHDEVIRAKDGRLEEMREALTEASLANVEKDRTISTLEGQLNRKNRTPK